MHVEAPTDSSQVAVRGMSWASKDWTHGLRASSRSLCQQGRRRRSPRVKLRPEGRRSRCSKDGSHGARASSRSLCQQGRPACEAMHIPCRGQGIILLACVDNGRKKDRIEPMRSRVRPAVARCPILERDVAIWLPLGSSSMYPHMCLRSTNSRQVAAALQDGHKGRKEPGVRHPELMRDRRSFFRGARARDYVCHVFDASHSDWVHLGAALLGTPVSGVEEGPKFAGGVAQHSRPASAPQSSDLHENRCHQRLLKRQSRLQKYRPSRVGLCRAQLRNMSFGCAGTHGAGTPGLHTTSASELCEAAPIQFLGDPASDFGLMFPTRLADPLAELAQPCHPKVRVHVRSRCGRVSHILRAWRPQRSVEGGSASAARVASAAPRVERSHGGPSRPSMAARPASRSALEAQRVALLEAEVDRMRCVIRLLRLGRPALAEGGCCSRPSLAGIQAQLDGLRASVFQAERRAAEAAAQAAGHGRPRGMTVSDRSHIVLCRTALTIQQLWNLYCT